MAEREPKSEREFRLFTCNNFRGHYPVGTAAVIVHRSMLMAKKLLLANLKSQGLEQDEDDEARIVLKELPINGPGVYILRDGEY